MQSSVIRNFERAMERATTYEEWKEAALAQDASKGLDRWKAADQSDQYDYVAIRLRLDRMRAFRSRHDHEGLLFNLNEGIHGNMCGMGKDSLYKKAAFGTKQLIIDYIDETVDALEYLASDEVLDISFEEKLDFFRRADHCFGRSAFMMSGSGSLLYFHMGVVKALLEEGLLPDILSGSSGGSIVGSMLCTHTDEELKDLFDASALDEQAQNAKMPAGDPMADPSEVQQSIATHIPDMTFAEAYKHTGRRLNISVAAAETHQTSRLLNAITTPNVLIREAIMASCAVPGVFPPVMLQARDKWGERQPYLPSRKWVDGSMSDDLPAKRLARLYGVNHYIVSQTNPHVLPFISDAKRENNVYSILQTASIRSTREWINAWAEIMHTPLQSHQGTAQMMNTMLSLMNQDYMGDINILPRSKFQNPTKLLAQRTIKEIKKLVNEGQRAAWPKIEMIRHQTKISRTLHQIVQAFEEQYLEGHKKTQAAVKPARQPAKKTRRVS